MRFTVVGYHLKDRQTPLEVPLRFVRQSEGLAVMLGHIPIALIQQTDGERYRIRTVPWAPQFGPQFVSLNAAVYAMEHLLQTGGAADWWKWPAEVKNAEELLIHLS